MGRVLLALLLLGSAFAGADEVATRRTVRLAARSAEAAPSRGPRTALVTVDFFCNYAHIQCVRGERALRRVLARHPGDVRIVYHQVALPFRDADLVAQVAVEAWAQGRFAQLADVVASRGAPLRARSLAEIARRAGLDLARLRESLVDRRHRAQLDADAVAREELGVPTFGAAWNGMPSGDLSVLGVEHLYAVARARAARLVAEGVPRERLYGTLVRDAAAARAAARRGVRRVRVAPPRARVDLGGAPLRGDPAAPVTLVVFTDYQCPYCRRQEAILRRVLRAYPDRVRIAWKHFPLPQHAAARAAAEAAACAHRQGRFFEVHETLVRAGSRLGAVQLPGLLAAAGVDMARYRADAAAGRCVAAVAADLAQGRALDVDSTPTTFVNGMRLVGLRGLGELAALVEEESAPGVLSRLTDEP